MVIRDQKHRVTVVVPVFGDGRALPTLVERVFQSLGDELYELLLVDDGNPASTWAAIGDLASEHERVRGIRLGKNVGQHAAVLAGVMAVSSPIIVTMDDDLQHPPEDIPILLAHLDDSYDVVYGVPERVKRSMFRRFASRFARSTMAAALNAPSAENLTSFRAFRTELRNGFGGVHGRSVSIDALLAWSTDKFSVATVGHDERDFGRSTYGFRKLVRLAVDTATSYSTRPLRVAMYLGLVTVLVGMGLLANVLIQYLGGSEAPAGFRFLAASVVVFSGVQLLMLGVIGEYLGRMHYRVMGSPPYRIAEFTSGNDEGARGWPGV